MPSRRHDDHCNGGRRSPHVEDWQPPGVWLHHSRYRYEYLIGQAPPVGTPARRFDVDELLATHLGEDYTPTASWKYGQT